VLLADDNAAILRAVQRLLHPSFEVVGTVMSGGEIVKAETALKPDVVVLDLFGGLDTCNQIKQASPQTKVVILTAINDAEVVQRAISLGASAYVIKSQMADTLIGAIHTALLQ
jgi:DNA-binding NarL/FixJ family response regulator